VSAIAVAGIIVFPAFIRVPEVEQRSFDRPTRARQYLAVNLDQPSPRVRLNEISAFRRTRLEERAFDLSNSLLFTS
jgi:hypothetical protein